MTSGWPIATLKPMPELPASEPVTEVVLRFSRRSEPICGRLSADGVEREFEGWLGLVRALENALDPHETNS